MRPNVTFVLTLVVALSLLSGCDRDCCCNSDAAPAATVPSAVAPKEAPPKSAAPSLPQVAGKWEGKWASAGHPGHGGGLKCEAKESGAQKWEAVFTAEFGQTQSYNVKLDGKPGDGKVLFGGSVDLGPGGGVFTWTGDANATGVQWKIFGRRRHGHV